jgi:hypothetical protein
MKVNLGRDSEFLERDRDLFQQDQSKSSERERERVETQRVLSNTQQRDRAGYD